LRCWVSDAQVAEIPYTAFTAKKNKAITARLIVRRVRDQNRKAAAGQDELFPGYRVGCRESPPCPEVPIAGRQ
jgi:hypothetical protein